MIPVGILAAMMSHARRSVGVSMRRLPSVAKNALTISIHSR
jgi:hypothetical protein